MRGLNASFAFDQNALCVCDTERLETREAVASRGPGRWGLGFDGAPRTGLAPRSLAPWDLGLREVSA